MLLVSTAQGVVGRDVAALVGASLLNLVDAVIREQGALAFSEERRGALVVVDEMQSMPGVDYESPCLSELGKFGASFILATQSLAKLDDLSPHHARHHPGQRGLPGRLPGGGQRRPAAGVGAGQGPGVSEDDIVSLDVHHCYVRATVGTERMPPFSMMVQQARAGQPGRGPPHPGRRLGLHHPGDRDRRPQERGRQRVHEFRREVERIRQSQTPPDQGKGEAGQNLGRDGQRSKHFQPPTGGQPP